MPQTDAVYNYDDLHVSNETPNDLGFLGQYSNEKFITTKVRKSRITYAPDNKAEAIEIGKKYVVGYVPARGILLRAWAIVNVDTAEAAKAKVKLGDTDLFEAATETEGAVAFAVPVADGYVGELTEVTVEFDAVVTPEAGSITIITEYISAEVIEGPFGS